MTLAQARNRAPLLHAALLRGWLLQPSHSTVHSSCVWQLACLQLLLLLLLLLLLHTIITTSSTITSHYHLQRHTGQGGRWWHWCSLHLLGWVAAVCRP